MSSYEYYAPYGISRDVYLQSEDAMKMITPVFERISTVRKRRARSHSRVSRLVRI